MPLAVAWSPYFAIALLLVITRLPNLGLKALLIGPSIRLPTPGIDTTYSLQWLYNPGTLPFMFVAILTHVAHRMDGRKIKRAWKRSFEQVGGAAIALGAGIALVQLMVNSGDNGANLPSMLTALAEAMASLAGRAYIAVSPFIGVLGSFLSGSNTVSNILFSSLQFETATILRLEPAIIVSLQIVGGGIGNMICVNNIVAVAATVGIKGVEGNIIRRNAIPTALYALGAIGVALLVR